MTIIYCMGIGSLTLFIGALYPVNNNDDVAEALNRDNNITISTKQQSKDETSEDNMNKQDYNNVTSSIASTTTPLPSAIENVEAEVTMTPTPPPVYELTVGAYPEIDKFFYDYYVAWNSCDYSVLKSLTTDSSKTIPLLDLKKETQFIDDIRDNVCYVMKSYEEDSYIVYAYYEIKYVNIKTTLPRLDKFYLITDVDGNLKIDNSDMDEMLKTYYDERDQDMAVASIIKSTNEKAEAALEKDESLRLYVEALYRQ